jgi:hypothetical protein
MGRKSTAINSGKDKREDNMNEESKPQIPSCPLCSEIGKKNPNYYDWFNSQ